jgi:hypothetical protein
MRWWRTSWAIRCLPKPNYQLQSINTEGGPSGPPSVFVRRLQTGLTRRRCMLLRKGKSEMERRDELNAVVSDIRGQVSRIECLNTRLRELLAEFDSSFSAVVSRRPGEYWKAVVFADSLVRIRLFLEQNFSYIETMGVLAISRYIFELTVWLKLLQKDARYGLIFYYELLKKQCDFYAALRKHSEREILYLREIEKTERLQMDSAIAAAMRIPDEGKQAAALSQVFSDVTNRIDEDAARKFSLYAEQARINGYGFQAHMIETNVVPGHSKALGEIESELHSFKSLLSPDVNALIKEGWNWKRQAEKVQMGEEYEFIYTYTSLLMHATPVSLTTDQKNLELEEIHAFLKYIRVRIVDAVAMADDFLKSPSVFVH